MVNSDTEANTLLTYLIDATNNQLDNKEYLEFLKLIIKAELNSIENHELSSPNPEKSIENYTKKPNFKIMKIIPEMTYIIYILAKIILVLVQVTGLTGYVQIKGSKDLIIFMNIGIAGKTGHNFKNDYDKDSGIIKWFGKPKSHSKQPTFINLFSGKLTPHFFARWDAKSIKFKYLGTGSIINFKDNAETPYGSVIEVDIQTSN